MSGQVISEITPTTQLVDITTSNPTKCDLQPENPWCGHFGAQQIVEIVILVALSLVGTIGNLIVIFSIILEKKVYKNGNVFIINLAIADLCIVTIIAPNVLANVVETGNVLSTTACQVFGFILHVPSLASLYSLVCIALNRYWAITRPMTFKNVFSTKRIYLMALSTWIFGTVLTIPAVLGWTSMKYNYKTMLCIFDETASISYNTFLALVGHLFPMAIVALCYGRLFSHVRMRRRQLQAQQEFTKQKRSLQREISLLKTLVTTVVVFAICFMPLFFYNILNLSDSTTPTVSKILTWIAAFNSVANFFIYGFMNRGFRQGYKNLFIFVSSCGKRTRLRQKRQTPKVTRNPTPKPTPVLQNSKSETGK